MVTDINAHPPTTFKESVRDVLKLTAMPIVGSFFHPFYSIVNSSVLGHGNNSTALAGLGLGSLTLGIAVIAV